MELSIDSLLGLLLQTILHPLGCWLMPWLFAFVPLWACAAVLVTHLAVRANHLYNTRGPWPAVDPKKDKVLITGGSGGLGQAIVETLTQCYPSLPITVLDLNPPLGSHPNVTFIPTDLSDLSRLSQTLAEVDRAGPVTVVVNNAGIRHTETLTNLSDHQVAHLFRVNALAPIKIIRHYLRRAIPSRRLYVVTVSSILGTLAPANLSVYSATKAALIQIHESAAHEISPSLYANVRMLMATPGQLDTAMFGDIAPPNQFLAPVVPVTQLANTIHQALVAGERGTISMPFYATLLPALKCAPYALQEACRWFSGMDLKIKEVSSTSKSLE